MNQGPELIDQHLLSRVLVRRFASDDGELRFYDLRSRRTFVKSYGSAGRGGAYTPHAPKEIEAEWGRLESQVPAAFAAVDSGTVFDSDTHAQTLKHLIALHFFRTDANRRLWNRTVSTRLEGTVDPERARAYLGPDRNGMPQMPTYSELITAFIDPETPARRFDETFQGLQLDWFQRSGLDVRRAGLEIWDTESDLVLADAGVLALDSYGNLTDEPFQGVACLILPIGRRLMISLGPANTRGVITTATADRVNRWSVEAAHRWAYSHPDTDSSRLVFGE